MANKNQVTVTIVGDADQLSRTFKQVGDDGEKMEGRFKRTAGNFSAGAKAAFAGVGVAAVAGFGKQLFQLGADLESMNQKSTIVFGESMRIVDDWAKSNANAMGLTAREATFAAASIADLLKPMGFTSDAAAEQSTKLLDLAGALSVWSGGQKSAQDVTEILTGAILGEYDSLKSLGISLSAAEVEAQLAARGQNELTGAARQQAEALIVQELLINKSTDALTNYKDSTRTTNEQMAEQAANFRELQEKAGSFVHGALTDYATWALNDGPNITGFWADYNRGIDEVVIASQRLIDKLRGVRDAARDAIKWLEDKRIASVSSGSPTGSFFDRLFGFGGGRAAGGPVSAGTPYLVGERGPEIVVPSSNGTVIPNKAIGGGTSVVISFNATAVTRESADAVVRVLEDHFRRGGAIAGPGGRSLRPV